MVSGSNLDFGGQGFVVPGADLVQNLALCSSRRGLVSLQVEPTLRAGSAHEADIAQSRDDFDQPSGARRLYEVAVGTQLVGRANITVLARRGENHDGQSLQGRLRAGPLQDLET